MMALLAVEDAETIIFAPQDILPCQSILMATCPLAMPVLTLWGMSGELVWQTSGRILQGLRSCEDYGLETSLPHAKDAGIPRVA